MSNPHLEMANEVFNMMFGLPKIAPPEPLPDLPELTPEQLAEAKLTEERT